MHAPLHRNLLLGPAFTTEHAGTATPSPESPASDTRTVELNATPAAGFVSSARRRVASKLVQSVSPKAMDRIASLLAARQALEAEINSAVWDAVEEVTKPANETSFR